MSEIKYGLISQTDARCLEKTIDLLLSDDSHNYPINITEIGVYGGDTGKGICEYIKSKGRNYWVTGIDNFKDKETVRFPYNEMIYGNSNEVYNQIPDGSQHLILQDACHCFACTVSSFFCYAQKVKVGGFMAWHDTGKHIQPFKDFQHGDKENPDAYISVRDALRAIGLVDYTYEYNEDFPNKAKPIKFRGWELIFDEADPENEAGGVTIFKKLY